MNQNSTHVAKAILLSISLSFFFYYTHAQCVSQKLQFTYPLLKSGTSGQEGAVYEFINVSAGVNAEVKLKKIRNGARLVNIDDSSFGYKEAWQPVIGGPSAPVNLKSSIEWEVKFVNSSNGKKNKFNCLDLSAIDIDGDNGRIQEFVSVNGYESYTLPATTVMVMTQNPEYGENSNEDDNDDEHQENSKNVEGLGPVSNRANIDTSALDTRINFKFKNISTVNVTIGAQIADNGYTGPVATDRFSSLYFKQVGYTLNSLPVSYRSFDVISKDNFVNVYWLTDAETKNDHFEVERSFDQQDFKTAGLVLGPQSTIGYAKQYSFKDAGGDLAKHPVIYYRLKQIDIDGRFTYSAVKMVRSSSAVKSFVQTTPNPYVESLNVNFVSEESGMAQISLVNTSGQIIIIKQSSVVKGYNNMKLSGLNSTSPGLYIVNVTINGKVIDRLKVIKQ